MDLKKAEPRYKSYLQQYRVFSFSGKEGTGIPADGVNELVYNRFADNHILTHILSWTDMSTEWIRKDQLKKELAGQH